MALDEEFVDHQIAPIGDTGNFAFVVQHWARVEDRGEVIGLEIWTVPPSTVNRLETRDDTDAAADAARRRGWPPKVPVPITTTVVRLLNVGSLIDVRRRKFARYARIFRRSADRKVQAWAPGAEVLGRGARGRPAVYDEAHYQEVAKVYQRAAASKDNHMPTAAVRAHFERKLQRPVSSATATKWVSVARNRYGFLPATRSGVTTAWEET